MHNMKKIPPILFFIFLLPGMAASAQPLPESAEIISDRPAVPNVTTMAVDSLGYLWLGAPSGISIYSGTNYRIIDSRIAPALSSDDIRALLTDKNGDVWIGTALGLDRARGNRIENITTSLQLVHDMIELDDNRLLVSASDRLVVVDKQDKTLQPVMTFEIGHLGCKLLVDSDKVYVCDLDGNHLYAFQKDDLFSTRKIMDTGTVEIHDMAIIDGILILATSEGILAHGGEYGHPIEKMLRFTKGRNVLSIDTINDSVLFTLDTNGPYIYHMESGNLSPIDAGPTQREIHQIITAHSEEDFWISSDHQPPIHLDIRQIAKKIMLPGLGRTERILRFLPLPADEGQLIVSEKHVYQLNERDLSITDITPSWLRNEPSPVHRILPDEQEGVFWTLTKQGTVCRNEFRDGKLHIKWVRHVPQARCLLRFKGETYAISPQRITVLTKDGEQYSRTIPDHYNFFFSTSTASGKYYLLGSDETEGTRFYAFTEEGEFILKDQYPSDAISIEDTVDKVYVGTVNHGLYIYDKEDRLLNHYDRNNILPDNSVTHIQELNGTIWIYTKTAVVSIRSQDGGIHVQRNPNPMYEMFDPPTIGRATAENFYYGGEGFLSCTPLVTTKKKESGPFQIDLISIDGLPCLDLPDEPGIMLKYKQKTFSVYYSHPSFNPTVSNLYSVKLNGYDKDWVYNGEAQSCSYSHVPPGRYRLEIRADSLPSAPVISIPVCIERALWLRWPFLFLYTLLAFSILAACIHLYTQWRIRDKELALSRQEQDLIKKTADEKMVFFNNISHEIRTPLTLIYGPSLELYKDTDENTRSHKLASLIKSNSERLLRLTDELLHFDRLSGPSHLRISEVDIVSLIHSFCTNFSFLLQQKKITFLTEIPETLSGCCDRDKLEKVFFNLMSNAIKYTPEEGRITVQLNLIPSHIARQIAPDLPEEGYTGTYISLAFLDSGAGIPDNKKKKIFERYERLNQQVGTNNPQGYGIGLNYAIYLSRIHHGVIVVTDNTPRGSIFTFLFPAGKEAYPQENFIDKSIIESYIPQDGMETKCNEVSVPEDAPTLLIVEDNQQMLSYIDSLLRGMYHTICVTNGEEASDCLSMSLPDIVLSDIAMPLKNGFELCQEIKQDPQSCHIPVILLTGMDSDEMKLNGMDAGADAYVAKPFNPLLLQKAVATIIENRRRIQSMLVDRTSITPVLEEDPLEQLNAHDRRFLEKLYQLMDEHLADENFSIVSYIRDFGISRSGLYSKIKGLVGESPQSLVVTYRLNKAMELLKRREYHVNEVGYMVGFASPSGFSRSFKKKFGIPPSAV